ncbi:ABC transporter ATP-binding protein [Bergeyella zoohelcum]|uniref:Uncharacterized ABC transporter ATP-binding protein YbhF n=1 Tax=Bergeyella zoohelcum TaxID=1015 RepID=A0A376C0M3_9FLAO|nr:ATP-binding cassette domain-containing protein [Bergeyella zoohelcum]EKB57078.1 hypothetical protein HMPREF9700_02295 [Bergeyella zoohelcum CCUG 30536]SSZ55566.1 Uncharacterized ABC transporter ATP-binding protein YbhF [Bergeyella zoohelcum]
MALKVESLSKTFGKQKALNKINISIEKGEIVGLLGPNGAGKSTLMKTIVGALKVEEGTVALDGFSVEKSPLQAKKKIGFLPENNPLYLEMFVKEYLYFIAQVHGLSKQRIEEVVAQVGLTPEVNKKIKQLSKGYRQRVGLAQAIIHQPELLILDEPTNGLDPNQIIEIRNVIKEIGKQKTIILSTHIMQEVEALCTRIILINKGEIIQDVPMEVFKGKYESLEQAFAEYTA